MTENIISVTKEIAPLSEGEDNQSISYYAPSESIYRPNPDEIEVVLTSFSDLTGNDKKEQIVSWGNFANALAKPDEYSNKHDCPLIKLARFGDIRSKNGSYRHDDNIKEIYGLEGDYDAGSVSIREAIELLRKANIKALIYSTPSYTGAFPRWRVLVPLSKSHNPQDRRNFVTKLDHALGGILAPESYTNSQVYYCGRVFGVEYVCEQSKGQCIDLLDISENNILDTPNVKITNCNQSKGEKNKTYAALGILDSNCSRSDWVKFGMAIKSGHGEDGWEIFHEWSMQSQAKYLGEADCRITWDSFKTDGGINIATLYHAANLATGGKGFCVTKSVNIDIERLLRPLPVSKFRLLSDEDLASLPSIRWRIPHILPETGIAAVFGESGAGKSFLTLDMAMAIASGSNWFGYKVKKCPVVYCALEGEAGIKNRVKAHHEMHGNAGGEMHYLLQPFDLKNTQCVDELVQEICRRDAQGGVIFLDTLNRAVPDSDENSSKDMGLIIAAAKRLQSEVNGLVVLVHHTGKDASRGLRGHSSLHAALDSAIEVKKSGGLREWNVYKSKDGEDGISHSFKLEQISLGIDEDGQHINSCAVIQEENVCSKVARSLPPKSGNQKIILNAIKRLLQESSFSGEVNLPNDCKCITLEEAIEKTRGQLICEPKRQTERAKDAIEKLIDKGFLSFKDGWIWKP